MLPPPNECSMMSSLLCTFSLQILASLQRPWGTIWWRSDNLNDLQNMCFVFFPKKPYREGLYLQIHIHGFTNSWIRSTGTHCVLLEWFPEGLLSSPPPLEAWGRFSPLTTSSLNHGGSGTEPSWIRGHTYTQKLFLKMSKILLLYKASLGEFVLRCKAATLIKPVYFIVVFVFLHSILLALWVEGVVMSFFSMSYKFIWRIPVIHLMNYRLIHANC